MLLLNAEELTMSIDYQSIYTAGSLKALVDAER